MARMLKVKPEATAMLKHGVTLINQETATPAPTEVIETEPSPSNSHA